MNPEYKPTVCRAGPTGHKMNNQNEGSALKTSFACALSLQKNFPHEHDKRPTKVEVFMRHFTSEMPFWGIIFFSIEKKGKL